MEHKECCYECKFAFYKARRDFCAYPSCSCHKPLAEEEGKEHTGGNWKLEELPGNKPSPTPPMPPFEWEKERTEAISEMFDNIDENGNYPTTKLFERLDKAVRTIAQKEREAGYYEGEKNEFHNNTGRVIEAYEEGKKAACDYIYDKINEYCGAKDNPDYEMPDGAKLVEIIDEARSAALSKESRGV